MIAKIKRLILRLCDLKSDMTILLITAKNLLNRDFNQPTSSTHWVGDITYIKTYQAWSYLASALDLASRQVVGWALSR